MSRGRWAIGTGAAALLLVGLGLAAVALAVGVGRIEIGPGVAWRAALHGLGLGAPVEAVAQAVVWELRLPRALLAWVAGGGLAVVGVAMQALVRNPLAEPYLLGASSGASAGAALFALGFLPAALEGALSLSLAAFAGSLLALGLVVLVAREGRYLPTARLLLAGVAVSALLAAVTAFAAFAAPDADTLRAVLFWLLGSFAGAGWPDLLLPTLATFAATLGLWALARPLDALLGGEEAARALGVETERLKLALVVGSALVVGALVAACGVIGFVGLIVPHAVRLLVGPAHRKVVPLSLVGGGAFLVLADLAARTVLGAQELPVGVLTALCGVPFFLVLLRRADGLPS